MSAALNITDPNCTHGSALLRQGPGAIIARVAAEHKLSPSDLTGPSHKRAVVRARYEAMLAVRLAYPGWSLKRIGQVFGDRDHTTIRSALRQMGVVSRARWVARRWSEAEDALIRQMWADGAYVHEIADILKAAPRTVGARRVKLGLPNRPRARLTEEQVREIRAMPYREGTTIWGRRYLERINDTARRFGVDASTIREVRACRTWKRVGRSA